MTRIRFVLLLGLALSLPTGEGLAKAPPGRYVVDATGVTVFDTYTKLTWQRTPPPSDPKTGLLNWADAKAYCKGLVLVGTGWRLPEITELRSIVDYKQSVPAIDPVAFPKAPAEYFWSNTPYMGAADAVWIVSFYTGDSSNMGVTGWERVRCVR